MWISSETVIGNTSDANYDMEAWNDVYASIKVNVAGDFNKKKVEKQIKYGIGTDALKSIVDDDVTNTCTDFETEGGLVAINTEGTLYQEDSEQEIREYRYVGPEVNNYIYFNCQDGKEQNGENCEIWRIFGIFKDEEGQEHLKITKDDELSLNMLPETFESKGTTYNIYKFEYYPGTTVMGYSNIYWNKKVGGINNNDWTTAGLQYWLNAGSEQESRTPSEGYMSYLSKNAKSMIETSTYYLGNVNVDNDTLISSFTNERGNKICTIDEEGHCAGGDIWEGNQAEWTGNIALMYPSDLGYTTNSCYWTEKLSSYTLSSTSINSSWLSKDRYYLTNRFWFLSPSYSTMSTVIHWSMWAGVSSIEVDNHDNSSLTLFIRPTLYLKSNAKITSGNGTEQEPYVVALPS